MNYPLLFLNIRQIKWLSGLCNFSEAVGYMACRSRAKGKVVLPLDI